MDNSEWRSVLGESIHTGFRKGTEHPDSTEAWQYLDQMSPELWNDVLGWTVYCLESMGLITVDTADGPDRCEACKKTDGHQKGCPNRDNAGQTGDER